MKYLSRLLAFIFLCLAWFCIYHHDVPAWGVFFTAYMVTLALSIRFDRKRIEAQTRRHDGAESQ